MHSLINIGIKNSDFCISTRYTFRIKYTSKFQHGGVLCQRRNFTSCVGLGKRRSLRFYAFLRFINRKT